MKGKKIELKKCFIIFSSLLVTIFFVSTVCFAEELFTKASGIPNGVATDIFVGEEKVWFASGEAGAAAYDKQSGEFTTYSKDNKLVSGMGEVRAVAEAFGKVWFGTDMGLSIIDQEGKVSFIKEIEVPSISKPGQVRKAFLTSAMSVWHKGNALWVCCGSVNGGLYRFDGESWLEIRFGKSVFNYVSDIEITDTDIWYSTSGFGIFIYNKKSKKWKTISAGSTGGEKLPHNSVTGLIKFEGNIWASTSAGVCKVKRDKAGKIEVEVFSTENTEGAIRIPNVNSITVTLDDEIFIGTIKGVSKYSNGSWEEVNFKDKNDKPYKVKRIFAITNDEDNLWVACNLGVLRMDL
jgi:ligand-binding sensor domain-containing protein